MKSNDWLLAMVEAHGHGHNPETGECLRPNRCKHELVVGTCATCLGTDGVSVPDPFEGVKVEELDPERDLGGGQ